MSADPTAPHEPRTVSLADEEAVKRIVVDTLFGLFPGADGIPGKNPASKGQPAPQKDFNGSVLPVLPPTWGGITAGGQPVTLTQAQSAGLPNAMFQIDDPKGVGNSGGGNYVKLTNTIMVSPKFEYTHGPLVVDGSGTFSHSKNDYEALTRGTVRAEVINPVVADFRATGSIVKFPGFTRLYVEATEVGDYKRLDDLEPLPELTEFAKRWREEIGLPPERMAVWGDVDAGMNESSMTGRRPVPRSHSRAASAFSKSWTGRPSTSR